MKRKRCAAAGLFFLSLFFLSFSPWKALTQESQFTGLPAESCAAENKTIEVLREEISYLQKDVAVREEKIRELRTQIGQIDNTESLDSKTVEEASVKEEEFSRELLAAKKELERIRQELSRSKQDNSRFEQEVAVLQQDRDKATEAAREITRLKDVLMEHEKKIKELTAQLAAAARAKDELELNYKSVQAQAADLRDRLKEKPSERVIYRLSPEQTQEFNRLKEDISAKEKELSRLRDDKVYLEEELDNARNRVVRLEKQGEIIKDKDASLQNMQMLLDEAREETDHCASELDTAHKTIATLKENLAHKPKEKIIYRSSPEQDAMIEKLKRDISDKGEDILHAQKTITTLEREAKACQGDVSALQQSLASCKKEQNCADLKREINECNKSKQEFQSRTARAEAEIEKLNKRLAEKPKENIIYKPSPVQEQAILTLEKRITSKDETIEALKKKVSQKIGPYTAEIRDLRSSLEEKEKKIEELTAVIKEIVTKIRASSGDSSVLSP